jgi:hypothetical protein
MISDRLLNEVERQKKYLARLPEDFSFPLFNAKQALMSQRRNGYRNTAVAAREIVDNAIEAGAKSVHIIFETKRHGSKEIVTSVAFFDDGSGMVPDMARYSLSWGGGTHFDEPGFIGRFGFGLPNASINQTLRTEVYTRTDKSEKITKAWLDAKVIPEHGLQTIPPPEVGELPKFVRRYLDRNSLTFGRGTVVVWVEPDRLTYRTAASLKELLLDDFGVTYRYLLREFELQVEGVKVEPVDPLFLEPGARYYRPEEEGGAQKVAERSLAVKLYRAEGANGLHLQKLDQVELDKIKSSKDSNGKVLAVGTIYYRVARLPLGLAVGRVGEGAIEPIDEFAKQRFEIRQSRRGMSFVRGGREIETVDGFPRSARDAASGLGDWPLLQSYAYHWGFEVRFGAELDDVFGITNDKQRVRPIEDFWRLLHDEEVDDLLNREQSWQHQQREARAKARREPQPTPEPTPAELSAAAVDTIVGHPTPIPEHQLPVVRNKFEKAASEHAQITGKSLEEAAAAITEEAKRRPYRFEYFEESMGPFYKPEWGLGGQIVIWVNRKHSFYDALYTAPMGKLAHESLNLFLIALGRGELKATNPTAKLWYEEQRTSMWSSFLATAMRDLLGRMPAVEAEEEVGAAVVA